MKSFIAAVFTTAVFAQEDPDNVVTKGEACAYKTAENVRVCNITYKNHIDKIMREVWCDSKQKVLLGRQIYPDNIGEYDPAGAKRKAARKPVDPITQSFGMCVDSPFVQEKIRETGGLKAAIMEANNDKEDELKDHMTGCNYFMDLKYKRESTEVEDDETCVTEYNRR